MKVQASVLHGEKLIRITQTSAYEEVIHRRIREWWHDGKESIRVTLLISRWHFVNQVKRPEKDNEAF